MADHMMLDPETVPPCSDQPAARILSEAEQQKLSSDTRLVSEFKQVKLEREAKKNWDLFYKRNTTKFFKDRHWTKREFEELCGAKGGDERTTLLEVGCGVGNFIFPLLEEDSTTYFYACDFSPRAVQFVKENALYDPKRCHAFQCDLTCDPLSDQVTTPVDIVTMIFVLSAIHPDKMVLALKNIYNVLRPGGCVLFRDYGQHDFAMLRFAPGHKLSDNFYVRQDGTRAYYFTRERLAAMVTTSGLEVTRSEYVIRETVNKKEGLCVPRVFLQAKFTKRENKSAHTDTVEHGCVPEEGKPRNWITSEYGEHIVSELITETSANREQITSEQTARTSANSEHVTSEQITETSANIKQVTSEQITETSANSEQVTSEQT